MGSDTQQEERIKEICYLSLWLGLRKVYSSEKEILIKGRIDKEELSEMLCFLS